MVLRDYYLCPIDLAQTSHFFQDSHWIDLGNGLALISIKFSRDVHQDAWEQQVNVNPLPHLFDPSVIDPGTIQLLAHIGAQPGQTIKDVRKLARAVHPLM